MKETFYFRHDYNAHDDNKLKKVIRRHGAEGFGIYWYLVELLYQETGSWFLPKDYEDYAIDLRVDSKCIASVVEEFGLFEFDEENFWNKRIDEEINSRSEISSKRSKAAKLRWRKGAKSKASMQVHSKSNAIGMLGEEKRGKEKKEKDIATVSARDENFDNFWERYPKKVGKGDAERAWKKIKSPKESLVEIKKALQWQKESDQWKEENGRFIPNPSTYINQRRWEDEPSEDLEKKRRAEEARKRLYGN